MASAVVQGWVLLIVLSIGTGCSGDEEGKPQDSGDTGSAGMSMSAASDESQDGGVSADQEEDDEEKDDEEEDDELSAESEAPDGGGAEASSPASEETGAEEPLCADEAIALLMFQDTLNTSELVSTRQDDAFYAEVDATAGGRSPTESFVYARFTEDGLQQVDIDDEAALSSTEWHVAMRRFVIRLNSGVSGPGNVVGGRTAPDTDFDALSAMPEGQALHEEAYFTESCDFVPDTSGIGAPATVLSSFWTYSSCLEMTGNVYVVQWSETKAVKLQVLAYYGGENQALCEETGMVAEPSLAGQLRVRWDFVAL